MNTKLKNLIEERMKEEHPVMDVLLGVKKLHESQEIIDGIDDRKRDIRSIMNVIEAALACRDYDESFYQEHVGHMMYMLRDKFDELEILFEAYAKYVAERPEKILGPKKAGKRAA